MPYQRPRGLHEISYTIGEKIVEFYHQLFLLRVALVKTVENPTYYPDLFRALRVLIIDGERGRLGDLAKLISETHAVPSRVLVSVEPRENAPSENARVTFPRAGLESLFLPNHHSRWLALRGLPTTSDKASISVDFWDYIELDVVAFMPEFGAEITRQRLIAEVCNTRDVAHATDHYPTFLRFTNALGTSAPYFLEIAQDVAYEILVFGMRIIDKCNTQYSDQIAKAWQYIIPIPTLMCGMCHMLIAVNEFICQHCNTLQLPPLLQRWGPHEQLTSLFHFGRVIEKSTGSLPLKMDLTTLTYNGISEYLLVDIAEGNSRMLLKRTGDMTLLWRVDHDLVSHSAVWPLNETPEDCQATFILTWSPERVAIIATSNRGGLWEAASDRTFCKLNSG